MREKDNIATSAFFLFGPIFGVEGAKVASAVAHQGSIDVVNGLYTGLDEGDQGVRTHLGSRIGEIWKLSEIEQDWLNWDPTDSEIEFLKTQYPPGTTGKLIVADRRLGRGFVRDAFVRPNPVAARAQKADENLALRYVVNLMTWTEAMLRSTNPRVVFLYAIAGAPALALSLVSERLGILCLNPVPNRIRNLYFLDNHFRGRSRALSEQMASDSRIGIHSSRINEASAVIERFRASPQKPDGEFGPALPKTFIRRVGGILLRGFMAPLGTSQWWLFRRALFEIGCEVRSRARRFGSLWNSGVEPENFLYFPLHVSPEATTMVLAPDKTDQFAVIEAVAKALPPGYSLVVKEHMPMLGKRPRSFYRKLSRLPGVCLVDPWRNPFELIKRSKTVVTITGTVGQEALFLGKSVVALGESAYLNVGSGVFDATERPGDLAEILQLAVVSGGPEEQDLLDYVAGLLELSFPLEKGFLHSTAHLGDFSVSRGTLVTQILKQVTAGQS